MITWRSHAYCGENNPNWHGKNRRTSKSQALLALERDGHRCRQCGATEHLEVHHDKPVDTFGPDEYPHELENLITLCSSCHKKRHPGLRNRKRRSAQQP
jgi:5-methylcytosine-specific restriction endonuclease McrA